MTIDEKLDRLIDRAWGLGLEPSSFKSQEELEEAVIEAETQAKEERECSTCQGMGHLESPAENIGGELIGPDNRPCPKCQNVEEN